MEIEIDFSIHGNWVCSRINLGLAFPYDDVSVKSVNTLLRSSLCKEMLALVEC